MLPAWIIIIAVVLRLVSGATYALAVVKGRAKPNPVTWFFWALTPMIVFVAQMVEQVGWDSATTLALGLSPLIIFIISLKNNWNRSHFTPSTLACAVLAAIGIVLWRITDDPNLAIAFSILADIFGSIPTVLKAYKQPKSEVATPYLLSMASMVITLLAITEWSMASAAFPIYIFLINFVIFSLTKFELGLRKRPLRRRV